MQIKVIPTGFDLLIGFVTFFGFLKVRIIGKSKPNKGIMLPKIHKKGFLKTKIIGKIKPKKGVILPNVHQKAFCPIFFA